MDPKNLFRSYGEYRIKIVRYECESFLSLDELYAGVEARLKAEGSPLRSAPDDLPAQDLASPVQKADGPLSIEGLLDAYHARRDPGTANTVHESLFNVQRAVVEALAHVGERSCKMDPPKAYDRVYLWKTPWSVWEKGFRDHTGYYCHEQGSRMILQPTHWREMPPVPE